MLGEIVLVFSSNVFLFAYLPAVLLLYYLCPRRWRNLLLFVVSLVFYGWGEPVYLTLMLFTIALNYAGGLLIDRYRASEKKAKGLLALTVILNLGLLGFEFLKNFDYPYISRSITEFWRRWHISLSTWFREYVYIPLGGNRRGLKRQILNIFIVWALTGLWHGASWNFVLWGIYYALWLTAEKLFLLKGLEKLPSALRCLLVLLAVALGWMLFYFTDTGELFAFMGRLFSFRGEDVYSRNMILAYLPTMALAAFAATPAGKLLYHKLDGRPGQGALQVLGLGAVFLLCTAALASQSYNPFIYFRF